MAEADATPVIPRATPRIGPRLFDGIDIVATGVFGLEGALAATHAGLDLLGVTVIGFVVALGGGILRDVLLGDLPPAAFRSPSRIVVALLCALLGFGWAASAVPTPDALITTLDAVGMALFAVTGAQKASEHGMSLWIVGALGAITATGGGVIRDVILDRTPFVLSESVYGTAALAGALLVGVLLRTTRSARAALLAGFAVAFLLRMAAVVWGWELPSFRE